MSIEAERQAALLRAILDGEPQALPRLGLRGLLPGAAAASLQQGLQAYRGNAVALSERALSGTFGHLAALLGPQFASLAWTFWRRCPPDRGDLGEWGAALPGFLRREADDALADLAALEWALHQAERAPDATLDAASLAHLQEDPSSLRLVLRPGVQLLSVSAGALPLMSGHRCWLQPLDGDRLDVLVWRKDWRGRATQLKAATAAFVRSVLAGHVLALALDAALHGAQGSGRDAGPADEAGLDFTAFLQQALQEQWLMAVQPLVAEDGNKENSDEYSEDPAAQAVR